MYTEELEHMHSFTQLHMNRPYPKGHTTIPWPRPTQWHVHLTALLPTPLQAIPEMTCLHLGVRVPPTGNNPLREFIHDKSQERKCAVPSHATAACGCPNQLSTCLVTHD